MSAPCPCGSGHPYATCCGPIHRGEREAATAESLMRSRYSAYALNLNDYLLESWHPETRPGTLHAESIKWVGLEIVATQQGGEDDAQGMVEFRARYIADDRLGELSENSRFTRHQGRWVYVEGDLQQTAARQPTAIGRNAPCPCGSGLKYKRCCGK
ncbi:MAG: YchJ family protein [Gammaproteobacteria bacterium]|nr:YchJ family protein [Gammaproteobacteria bacterium]